MYRITLLILAMFFAGCKDSINEDIDECTERAKNVFDGSIEGGVARGHFVEACMVSHGYKVMRECEGGGLEIAVMKFNANCYVKQAEPKTFTLDEILWTPPEVTQNKE